MADSGVSRFATLRTWEGEQSRAFEELSFQLLKDRAPVGTRAIRTGNPDGGVEWYAVLPNGEEHGWQAKHVQGIEALLTAMTESVTRVAKERPTLRTLTFVISWNLATSKQVRNKRQLKSQREKYDDKVATWQKTIAGADKITFELVQGSDLLDELAKPQHEGRRWFWWGDLVLGPDWLRTHHRRQAGAAGEKYRPDLQVDIPIQRDLLAIGFDRTVGEHLRRLLRGIAETVADQEFWPHAPDPVGGPLFDAVKGAALALAESAGAFVLQAGDPPAVLQDLVGLLAAAQDAVDAVAGYERAAEAAWRELPADDPRKQQEQAPYRRRRDSYYSLVAAMRELSAWMASSSGRALQRRAYFLTGQAGSGKTHLLLDATRRALDGGRPAVFLAGAQLGQGNLWASIADQLGLAAVGADVLLQAMDAAGEAAATAGSRFLIIIDALNETVPADFWRVHLPALRSAVAQYPHVALVVSCRDTYRDLVLDGAEGNHYLQRSHPGFADREVEATHTYFAHYGLQAPKIPLLTPEFTLPLFLRMYCESLAQAGVAAGHEGHQGRVTIFERYLAVKTTTVARRLAPAATSNWELDAARTQVTSVLDALLDEMARQGREGLTTAVAETVTRQALEGSGPHPVRVLGLLQEEGVVTRERLYLGGNTYGEGIRVVFQAFADFLLLTRRLAACADPLHDPALAAWLAQECSLGIIEAATVLFPEVHGIELPDLLHTTLPRTPSSSDNRARGMKHNRVRQLFRSLVEMLPYRASAAVTDRSVELLNDALPVLSDTDVFRTLFILAPQPGNRLNAERLHATLARLRMPVRDSSFGFATYYEIFDDANPASRLARWAAAGPYPDYDPTVVELACIPLCWLLSSPNRFMRDWITKALVQLLRGHLDVMRALVERFWSVDDPYVVQRVIMIAYGCLLRSAPGQAGQAAALAEAVHTRVFTPPVRADELLLDAARGITRWAVEHTLLPEDASAAAARPYGIAAPSAPPTEEAIDARYGRSREVPEDPNYLSIFVSVLNLGDFGHYVVESGMHHFSRHRIGQPVPDNTDTRPPRFVKSRWAKLSASLRPEQKQELADWLRDPDPYSMGAEDPFTDAQRDLLDAVWKYPKMPDHDYPGDRARRWVFRRTLSLGWTPARFAAVDRTLGRGRGRAGHKAERWGKKYQWMAYHELLARVADNYQSARRYDDQPYNGLHQIVGEREIDPSLPPIDFRAFRDDEGTGASAWQPPLIRLTGWPPADLDFRGYRGDIQRLLADTASEPTVATSMFVRDRDGHDWVVLESYIKKIDPSAHKGWRGLQETSAVDTLLIAAGQAPEFVTALAGGSRNTVHDLLDTHGHVDCCYIGEVGRTAPACYHRHAGFEAVEVAGRPFSIGRTVETYAWEGTILDCSIGETASSVLPSALLQRSAGLSFDMRGPSWLDAAGSPVFGYYQEPGNDSRSLLVRATYLRDYLAERQLELVVLHWFERIELTDAYDGPFPAISASIAARMGADLALHEGRPRRDERDLTGEGSRRRTATDGVRAAQGENGQDDLP